MMSVSYPLLLLSWVFLLPVIVLSFRRGEKPVALLLIFGLNVLFTGYEAYMTFIWSKTVTAPIRIDIFGVVCILVVVNTLAGLSILFSKSKALGADQTKLIERAMGLIIIGISLNAVIGLLLVFRQGHKASQTLSTQKTQDFQTMFQDAHTVEHYFGD